MTKLINLDDSWGLITRRKFLAVYAKAVRICTENSVLPSSVSAAVIGSYTRFRALNGSIMASGRCAQHFQP
jgi:hypothetical protein